MLEYWYAALAEPHGLRLRVSDRERAKQKLYAARKAAGDPDLDKVSIIMSPLAVNEIWLVKNRKGEK